jgi:prophage DNA circulation protein
MGRSLRTYSFSGYLIGDLAPALQLALDTMIEMKGAGLLIHPTIGAVYVSVLSGASSVHRDRMRVIEVAFEFIEFSDTIFPTQIIAAAVEIFAAVASTLEACNSDLETAAAPAAAAGPLATGAGAAIVRDFAADVTTSAADPTSIVGMAAALPPPDANTSYGRYGAGSATVALPDGTTVATLQAQLANQRAAMATAGDQAVATADAYSGTTDIMSALSAIVEAARAGMTDPADQVRVLLGLAGFSGPAVATGTVGLGAAQATMQNAMQAACLQAVVVSLALASSSYQPVSYDDAAALRTVVADALDVVITAAADAGQDNAYAALKSLRASVIQDLTVRGASLPTVKTVTFPLSLPSLLIAERLYGDAGRADEIAGESGAVHPAFCPTSFAALAA